MKTYVSQRPSFLSQTWFLSACILTLIFGSSAQAVNLLPGDLIICDGNGSSPGKIIKVDSVTGDQTLIAQGGLLDSPFSVSLEPAGTILVTDLRYDHGGPAIVPPRVIRIDPSTGAQSVVTEGGLLKDPRGILVSPTGMILVAEMQALDGKGAIIQVNPCTGAQSLYASGPEIVHPWDLTFGPHQNLYVACSLTSAYVSIVKIAPEGAKTIISPGGPYYSWVGGLAVTPTGEIYTSDIYYNNGIIKVDPISGTQSMFVQWSPFQDPRDLVVDLAGRLAVVDENVSSPGKVIIVDPLTATPSVLTEGILLEDPYGITVVPKSIAIKISPTSLNLKSKGKFTVAIISNEAFSATEIDNQTLLFGDPIACGSWLAPEKITVEDVNSDQRSDLLLRFNLQDAVDCGALTKATKSGVIVGYTSTGILLRGEDVVRIVPAARR